VSTCLERDAWQAFPPILTLILSDSEVELRDMNPLDIFVADGSVPEFACLPCRPRRLQRPGLIMQVQQSRGVERVIEHCLIELLALTPLSQLAMK